MVILVLIGGLTACNLKNDTKTWGFSALRLNFSALVSETPSGEYKIEFGVSSAKPVCAEDSISGQWELREADGDLRAKGKLLLVPETNDEDVLITWQGVLDPGSYELTWGAPDYGGLIKVFEVCQTENGTILKGAPAEYYSNNYPPQMP